MTCTVHEEVGLVVPGWVARLLDRRGRLRIPATRHDGVGVTGLRREERKVLPG